MVTKCLAGLGTGTDPAAVIQPGGCTASLIQDCHSIATAQELEISDKHPIEDNLLLGSQRPAVHSFIKPGTKDTDPGVFAKLFFLQCLTTG